MSSSTEAFATSTERISPRKLALVAALIRGMNGKEALETLSFIKVRAAPIVAKVLKSALANASHNRGLEDPKVIRAEVGPKGRLKRFRPGSHGRASPIMRPFSHIRVVVADGK